MSKVKAHTIYRLKDGTRVPGTTTITGIIDKPALKYWANDLGLQGIDVRKYVDVLGDAGTLAHRMIECHLKGIECNTDEYSKNDIDLAENSFLKFLDWEKKYKYTLLHSELKIVSEKYRIGGTLDAVYQDKNKIILIDFKTAKAIYREMKMQVGGYALLYEENFKKIDECYILRIGRTEDEGFDFIEIKDIKLYQDAFLDCLHLYNSLKKLK